jgi:hypothetical protein
MILPSVSQMTENRQWWLHLCFVASLFFFGAFFPLGLPAAFFLATPEGFRFDFLVTVNSSASLT